MPTKHAFRLHSPTTYTSNSLPSFPRCVLQPVLLELAARNVFENHGFLMSRVQVRGCWVFFSIMSICIINCNKMDRVNTATLAQTASLWRKQDSCIFMTPCFSKLIVWLFVTYTLEQCYSTHSPLTAQSAHSCGPRDILGTDR